MRKAKMTRLVAAAAFGVRRFGFDSRRRGRGREETKPLPPLQKNFPLDQTFSLRELNGKPVSVGARRQPQDRRRDARLRLRRLQLLFGGDVPDQGSAPGGRPVSRSPTSSATRTLWRSRLGSSRRCSAPRLGPRQRRPGDQGPPRNGPARAVALTPDGRRRDRGFLIRLQRFQYLYCLLEPLLSSSDSTFSRGYGEVGAAAVAAASPGQLPREAGTAGRALIVQAGTQFAVQRNDEKGDDIST